MITRELINTIMLQALASANYFEIPWQNDIISVEINRNDVMHCRLMVSFKYLVSGMTKEDKHLKWSINYSIRYGMKMDPKDRTRPIYELKSYYADNTYEFDAAAAFILAHLYEKEFIIHQIKDLLINADGAKRDLMRVAKNNPYPVMIRKVSMFEEPVMYYIPDTNMRIPNVSSPSIMVLRVSNRCNWCLYGMIEKTFDDLVHGPNDDFFSFLDIENPSVSINQLAIIEAVLMSFKHTHPDDMFLVRI